MLALAALLASALPVPPDVPGRATLPWVAREEAKLVAPDAIALDEFGFSVALAGDSAEIGVRGDDDGHDDSGSTYVYLRSGTSWIQQAKLTASDAARGDRFGQGTAIFGDLLAIGAPHTDVPAVDAGSVYAFVRTGTTWTEEAELVPSQGASHAMFGYDLDLSGTTLVVGAREDGSVSPTHGAAYVYERTGTGWVQQAKLNAIASGGYTSLFGKTVSASGDTVVVGSVGHGPNWDHRPGAAFVFVRSGTQWNQQARLMASDGIDGDYFGSSVAVEGDTVIVGATLDSAIAGQAGSIYVFTRTGTTWTESRKLIAGDPVAGGQFGSAVDLSGDNLLVTAPGAGDVAPYSGINYLFSRSGSTWSQSARFTSQDPTTGTRLGYRAALDGDRCLLGAPHSSDAGYWSGSAYVFTLEPAPYASCLWYCGSGVNLDTFTVAAPFTLGGTFQGSITFGPPHLGVALAAYLGRFTFPLWSQEGLVDPTSAEILGIPAQFLANPAIFTWSVPFEPAYAGYRVYPQAAAFGVGSIRLTCAYDCTVGY